MPKARKIALLLLLLLLAGLLRAPLERPLGRELRATGILEQPLDSQTSANLGQTSAAIALGGLRSLVAAVLNFSKVVPAWDDRDWLGVFDAFQQIHTLQPRVSYYWEAAARYAADDAYADYRERPDQPEWQRQIRQQELFDKGIAYLDEGTRNLPEAVPLFALKARFLSDTYKREQLDYPRATEVLDHAVTLPDATDVLRRQRLYLMARVPERRREALDLAREIYATPSFRFPSVKSLLYALQSAFPGEGGSAVPLREIYRDQAEVLRSLFNYYQRRSEGYPMDGVREELDEVVAAMELPYLLDPLRNSDIKRVTLSLNELHGQAPLSFPRDPYAPEGHWGTVVDSFQEHGSQSPPLVRVLIVVLQELASVSAENRTPLARIFPDQLTAIRDLSNYLYDDSHSYPRDGVETALRDLVGKVAIPTSLDPVQHRDLFPLTQDWIITVRQHQMEAINRGVGAP